MVVRDEQRQCVEFFERANSAGGAGQRKWEACWP